MANDENTGKGSRNFSDIKVLASWFGFLGLVIAVVALTFVLGGNDASIDKPAEKSASTGNTATR